jgi:hypothetical protein
MTTTGRGRLALKALAAALALALFAGSASALATIITFTMGLACSIRKIGVTIGLIMFVYGGAKYVYSADDPGARKQALGICIAAIVAWLIISMAVDVINALGVGPAPAMPAC